MHHVAQYQVAPVPAVRGRSTRPVDPARLTPAELELFYDDLALLARRLLFSGEPTAPSDRQFLFDVARRRYPMKSILRLLAIAARTTGPEDVDRLPEVLRAVLATRHECESVPVFACIVRLGDARAGLDAASIAFLQCPTSTARARLLDASRAQYGAARLLADRLAVEP